MWPAIAIMALLFGFAAKRRKGKGDDEGGPLLEEGDPEATAEEAAAAAQEALEEAKAGAAEGDSDKAAGALEKAADAAQAAAGTPAQDLADALAKEVAALAAAVAQATGAPPPQTTAPKPTKTSPGLPPVSSEPDEVEVEVDDEAAEPVTVVRDAIKDAAKAAADALGVPTDAKTGVPPLAAEETKPHADPAGTVALAQRLLAREQATGWKQVDSSVRQWQGRQGLVQDGKFGPKSALRMGREVGVLPKIRYWPSGSAKKVALQKFRDDVHTLAATLEAQGHPEHSRALELSAELEDARAHGVASPKPVSRVNRVAQFKTLQEAIG